LLRPIIAGIVLFLLVGSVVCGQVSVTIQPTSSVICAGDQAVFSADVTGGTGTLFYQWYVDLVPISDLGNIQGSITGTLTINPAFPGDNGSYDVTVTDDTGPLPASSAPATLTVNPIPGVPTASNNGPLVSG